MACTTFILTFLEEAPEGYISHMYYDDVGEETTTALDDKRKASAIESNDR
jgi:hypothetical protein